MQEGLVSVIIPNYNYERYLADAIKSALSQTYSRVEVIVVDDGSKDGSPQIARSFGDKIRLIQQANKGVAAARNRGVDASSGEYVAFLDADDVWLPAKVERQLSEFDRDPGLGMVHVGVEEIDSEGNSLGQRLDGLEGNVAADLLMLERAVILGGGSGTMIRSSVFAKIGGFDTDLSTSADWDLFFRIAARHRVGFVPEVLLKYRTHGANMHANIEVMEHDMMLAFQKAFDDPSPEIASLRRKAYGNLHQNLAGSYYRIGDYPAFIRHAAASLVRRPSNLRHFIRPRRSS